MPFIPHTPESQSSSHLQRNDSKNPARTCRGITTVGRPCRRALPASSYEGVGSGGKDGGGFFCWQHLEQGLRDQHVPRAEQGGADAVAQIDAGIAELEVQSKPEEQKVWKTRQRRKETGCLFAMFGCWIGPTVSASRTSLPPARKAQKMQVQPSKTTIPMRATIPQRAQQSPVRPQPNRFASSHTQTLLSLIPNTLDPSTTSLLLAELAKPASHLDQPGYIYIFRLTDPDNAVQGSGAQMHGTMEVKIGRAANISRRMNQWASQCGYPLFLLKCYPLVPISHRVERLIHIELAGLGLRVRKDCKGCGVEHREWFKVVSMNEVERLVKRWVDWALRCS